MAANAAAVPCSRDCERCLVVPRKVPYEAREGGIRRGEKASAAHRAGIYRRIPGGGRSLLLRSHACALKGRRPAALQNTTRRGACFFGNHRTAALVPNGATAKQEVAYDAAFMISAFSSSVSGRMFSIAFSTLSLKGAKPSGSTNSPYAVAFFSRSRSSFEA